MSEPRKYRKKPVVIEAMQFVADGEHPVDSAHAIARWCGESCPVKWGPMPTILIPTLEGDMVASPGDYIIRGVQGEFYPCKPDIFAATYEVIPDA